MIFLRDTEKQRERERKKVRRQVVHYYTRINFFFYYILFLKLIALLISFESNRIYFFAFSYMLSI